MESVITVTTLFFLVATLYSTVGHGGGSGYLAVMALLGFAPEAMRPTALILNVCVSLIATIRFYRAGHFSFPIFWPFALVSVPAAYIGGTLTLPADSYRIVLGAVLVYSALHMFIRPVGSRGAEVRRPVLWISLIAGFALGLASGLIGVGGGIFLSPLLLFMGWANLRETAAVSAAFILVNSLAGLAGQLSSLAEVPQALPLWAVAVIGGGWLGSTYGSRRFSNPTLRRALALVLLMAGAKLIFT
jgi:uncharacterized membrane protein YfcA